MTTVKACVQMRGAKRDLKAMTIQAVRFALLLGVVVLICPCSVRPIVAQTSAYSPDKSSAERKAIVDALRAPVQRKLKQEVIFRVDHLKVQSGWAFLLGAPRRPDGGQIDYRDTPYADAYNAGAFDNSVVALLHKVGGQWRVVQYVIGATDVAYLGWDRRFHAPAAIFPHKTAGRQNYPSQPRSPSVNMPAGPAPPRSLFPSFPDPSA